MSGSCLQLFNDAFDIFILYQKVTLTWIIIQISADGEIRLIHYNEEIRPNLVGKPRFAAYKKKLNFSTEYSVVRSRFGSNLDSSPGHSTHFCKALLSDPTPLMDPRLFLYRLHQVGSAGSVRFYGPSPVCVSLATAIDTVDTEGHSVIRWSSQTKMLTATLCHHRFMQWTNLLSLLLCYTLFRPSGASINA